MSAPSQSNQTVPELKQAILCRLYTFADTIWVHDCPIEMRAAHLNGAVVNPNGYKIAPGLTPTREVTTFLRSLYVKCSDLPCGGQALGISPAMLVPNWSLVHAGVLPPRRTYAGGNGPCMIA